MMHNQQGASRRRELSVRRTHDGITGAHLKEANTWIVLGASLLAYYMAPTGRATEIDIKGQMA